MNKHTPGPWFSHAATYDEAIYAFTVYGGSNQQPIADLQHRDAAEANATLIAAAPDLLAAVKDLLDVAECAVDKGAYAGRLEIDNARAAIAKATGGQP